MGYWNQGEELNNGKYIVEKLLGIGGFGVTYKIEHTHNNKSFALKTLNLEAQNRSDFDQLQVKFINEAIALASCRHPHIVRVYPQVFQQNGLWCMVMEYVEGDDLADYLDEHGKFSEQDAIAIITKVGKALSYVHQQGFLHRDIKPANILLRKADLSPVLIDFGLAREYTPGTIRSMTNSRTERYAPIEQYQRNGNFGAWTDVYALAATLYALLTERPPVPSDVRKEVALNILTPPKEHNSEISDRTNEAILKGMKIEPGDRSQTVTEWLEMLKSSQPQSKEQYVRYVDTQTKPVTARNSPLKHKVSIPNQSSKPKNYPKQKVNRLASIALKVFEFDTVKVNNEGKIVRTEHWIVKNIGWHIHNESQVLRGGSWGLNPRYCRSASRGKSDKTADNYLVGLRCVLGGI